MPHGGTIHIGARQEYDDVLTAVEDTGLVIRDTVRGQLCEPSASRASRRAGLVSPWHGRSYEAKAETSGSNLQWACAGIRPPISRSERQQG